MQQLQLSPEKSQELSDQNEIKAQLLKQIDFQELMTSLSTDLQEGYLMSPCQALPKKQYNAAKKNFQFKNGAIFNSYANLQEVVSLSSDSGFKKISQQIHQQNKIKNRLVVLKLQTFKEFREISQKNLKNFEERFLMYQRLFIYQSILQQIKQECLQQYKFEQQKFQGSLDNEFIGPTEESLKKLEKLNFQLDKIYETQNFSTKWHQYKTENYSSPSNKNQKFKKESLFKQVIEGHRRSQAFHEACERGGQDDIKILQTLLDKYPKKYIRSTTDPEHLINKQYQGQTPLYIACKNGNLNAVRFLLDNGANINQKTQIVNGKKSVDETALDVAKRWGYKGIIEEIGKYVK